MPDVSVFFADMGSAGEEMLVTQLRSALPPGLRPELENFGSLKKRIGFAAGRVLLMKLLEFSGYSNEMVSEIEKDQFGKPFLKNGPYFNISHSHSLVVCAVSEKYPLGTDVEKIRSIKPENFKNHLHKDEWDLLLQNNFNSELFFGIWTKKEAALKAAGIGMRIPIGDVNTTLHPVTVQNCNINIKEIKTREGYAAHLALADAGDYSFGCQEAYW